MKQIDTDWQETYEKEFADRVAKAAEANAEKIVKSVVNELAQALNMDELQKTIVGIYQELETLKKATDKVAVLEAEVAHLKETEDSRIAAAISPIKPLTWGRSATQSKDNVVEEEDLETELAKQIKSAKGEVNSWLPKFQSVGGVN
jgi:hypothetical protein